MNCMCRITCNLHNCTSILLKLSGKDLTFESLNDSSFSGPQDMFLRPLNYLIPIVPFGAKIKANSVQEGRGTNTFHAKILEGANLRECD